jgi:hypothetical protein
MKQALNKIHRMPVEFYKEFDVLSSKRVFNRKDFLLSKDRHLENVYFLHDGVLRIFRQDARQQITTWIVTPGQVVYIPRRFFNQAGLSTVFIQTLSDSVISVIPIDQVEHLKDRFPECESLCVKVGERFEQQYEEYLRILASDGDVRYQYVMDNFPNLRNSAYIGVLAAFMSMSRSTYYRCVKKRMKNTVDGS